jgi:hypothetical protein
MIYKVKKREQKQQETIRVTSLQLKQIHNTKCIPIYRENVVGKYGNTYT